MSGSDQNLQLVGMTDKLIQGAPHGQMARVMSLPWSKQHRKYSQKQSIAHPLAGLDIEHLVYMPIGHVVLKIYVASKNFKMPSQYSYKPYKAYVYCWENKYMPRLKNHLLSWARNLKSLCALGQDLHAPGMWARLNVEPCIRARYGVSFFIQHLINFLPQFP